MSSTVKIGKIVCYLQHIMNKGTLIFIKTLLIFVLIYTGFSCKNASNSPERIIKIALRDAGDKLLLSNNDTTSIVKPVLALDDDTYQLSFKKPLVIQPDSLVYIIKTSFKKANVSQHYITEVLECTQNEVAYSYRITFDNEESLVPCSGRELQKACYTIQVHFTRKSVEAFGVLKYIIPIVVLLFAFLIYRKNSIPQREHFKSVGHFKFYPEQNKLVRETVEIALSKKECELLSIFVARPNETIKREELTKRVWEDNGVVVGRSLDTYISKLRKKLQADASVKLTNVHGVGYKLEVE